MYLEKYGRFLVFFSYFWVMKQSIRNIYKKTVETRHGSCTAQAGKTAVKTAGAEGLGV